MKTLEEIDDRLDILYATRTWLVSDIINDKRYNRQLASAFSVLTRAQTEVERLRRYRKTAPDRVATIDKEIARLETERPKSENEREIRRIQELQAEINRLQSMLNS